MADDQYRALLTPREREILADEADVSDSYYYRVVTRVRNKLDRLEADVALLDEAHDTLGDEARAAVCDDAPDTADWDADPQPGDDTPPAVPDEGELADTVREDVRGTIREGAADEFPNHQDTDACLAATMAAREFLREEPQSMSEIVAEIMPDHPLGYDVPDLEPGDRYHGAWWRKIVKPGLKAAPDVAYDDGDKVWYYDDNARGEQ